MTAAVDRLVDQVVEIKPPGIYERALVAWDQLEQVGFVAPSLRTFRHAPTYAELRDLCGYAARVRLSSWHEPRVYTVKRHRKWLAMGGVAWQHARGPVVRSPLEVQLMISSVVHDVAVADRFMECAFCSFLLLSTNLRAHRVTYKWNDWKLDVCRAHTDICALRYLIERGPKR